MRLRRTIHWRQIDLTLGHKFLRKVQPRRINIRNHERPGPTRLRRRQRNQPDRTGATNQHGLAQAQRRAFKGMQHDAQRFQQRAITEGQSLG